VDPHTLTSLSAKPRRPRLIIRFPAHQIIHNGMLYYAHRRLVVMNQSANIPVRPPESKRRSGRRERVCRIFHQQSDTISTWRRLVIMDYWNTLRHSIHHILWTTDILSRRCKRELSLFVRAEEVAHQHHQLRTRFHQHSITITGQQR